jgi:hypothetical protein
MEGLACIAAEARGGVPMQSDHYMANMGKPGRADQLGLERVDDLAGLKLRPVVAALRITPGSSVGASAGGEPVAPRRRAIVRHTAVAGRA